MREEKYCHIHGVQSSSRYTTRTTAKVHSAPTTHDGRCELDSHADTIVAGKHCTLLSYADDLRVCDVAPYSDQYEPRKGVPVATVATGYTASNGARFILVFHEALWMPEMDVSLLNPNQMRHFGVEVQDNPYGDTPMKISGEGVTIPLLAQGTTIYFNCWLPTAADLEDLPHVTLSDAAPWQPHEVQFPKATQDEIEDMEFRNVAQIRSDFAYPDGAYNFASTCIEGDVDGWDEDQNEIFDIGRFSQRVMASARAASVSDTIHIASTDPGAIGSGKTVEPIPIGTMGMTETRQQSTMRVQDVPSPRVFVSADRHSQVTPAELSE